MMKRNVLGQSGIEIGELGFGCMSLDASKPEESTRILREAFDAGVTFFDTADLYDAGKNEELVGQALQACRHEVVIATKVGNRIIPGQAGWTWDPSPAYIETAVEQSLRRLRTDYIDLYQLHGGTMDDPFDEIVETMERLQARGLIRAYGISSIRPNVILHYLKHSQIASVMMQYSLLDRRPEEWFPAIEEAGVSVIARGPVARGLLGGGKRMADGETYLQWTQADIDAALASIQEMLDGRSATQLSLAFAMYPKVVATAVPGASSLAQLRENLGVCTAPSLTAEEIRKLSDAFPAAKYEAHRA